MDFGDFLRSFLGLRGRERRDFPRDFNDCDCENENDSFSTEDNDDHEFHFFFGDKSQSMDDMFHHFHGDMHRQMESLQRQMEDMLKGFGTIASEHFPPEHGPKITDEPESQPNDKGDRFRPFFIPPAHPYFKFDKGNPRDFMLKENEDVKIPNTLPSPPVTPHEDSSSRPFRPFRRLFPWNQPSQDQIKDTDLDGKYSSADAVEMIKRSNEDRLSQNPPRQGFFSGSSVTMTTVRGPDGKIEQKKVVRDSSGRKEIAVTRSVDGQSHIITTITGPNGLEESREDFKNMDENDIRKFQEKWDTHQSPQRNPNPPIVGPPNPPVIRPSHRLDPKDMDLFTKLFGGPPK